MELICSQNGKVTLTVSSASAGVELRGCSSANINIWNAPDYEIIFVIIYSLLPS